MTHPEGEGPAGTGAGLGPAEPDRLLTALHRLEEHWRADNGAIVSVLRPGLTEEQIDAATGPLGLRLPVEARVWWGWHDGVEPGHEEHTLMGKRHSLNSLGSMVQVYREQRGYPGADDPDVRIGWRPSWFPLLRPTQGNTRILFDCDVPDAAAAAVGQFEPGFNAPPDGQYGSITDLVEFWVACFDTGAYTHTSYPGTWDFWEIDYDRLPLPYATEPPVWGDFVL